MVTGLGKAVWVPLHLLTLQLAASQPQLLDMWCQVVLLLLVWWQSTVTDVTQIAVKHHFIRLAGLEPLFVVYRCSALLQHNKVRGPVALQR